MTRPRFGIAFPGIVGLAAGFAFTLTASTVRAQESAPSDDAPKKRPLEYHFKVAAEHDFKAEVDGPGKAGVSRAKGEFTLGVPVGDHNQLGFTLAGERSWYDFDHADKLSPGFSRPFDDTREISLSANLFIRQAEQWGWYVAGIVLSSIEDGAKTSDSLTYGGMAGFRYFFSETLSAGAGVGVLTRLEDSALPVPAIDLDWQFAPQWRLHTQGGRDVGVTLEFSPTERLTLSLDAAYEYRAYRLDDQGLAPKGVASDQRIPVAVGVSWDATENITLAVRGGAYVWQRYKVEDRTGSEISQADTNPQGFVMVSVQIEF